MRKGEDIRSSLGKLASVRQDMLLLDKVENSLPHTYETNRQYTN